MFKSLCLQEVLDIARLLLVELGQHNDCEIEEKKSKLEQLKTVLEMWVMFYKNTHHRSSHSAFLASSFTDRSCDVCFTSGFSHRSHFHTFTMKTLHLSPLDLWPFVFVSLSFPSIPLLFCPPICPLSSKGNPAWMSISTHPLPPHFKGWGFTALIFVAHIDRVYKVLGT